MALLQECPRCRARVGLERWVDFEEGGVIKKRKVPVNSCECGFKLAKASGRTYWIEYYLAGRRKRERIGPSKTAAEQRLREVLKARVEEL